MRTGQPIISRPAWYDRNPTVRVAFYNAISVTPHAVAERLSYTCPAGKKAMVELLSCRITRQTVATADGFPISEFSLTPSGRTETFILIAQIFVNTVGEKAMVDVGSALTLLAGDVLKGKTGDISTGGTCAYHLAYKITEFDA